MKARNRVLAFIVAVMVLLLVGPAGLGAQAGHPLCGIWVNTAYNGSPEPAVLVWAQDGSLSSYDESSDGRAAGCCCCRVWDRWSQEGFTFFSVIQVAPYLGGVELRASTSVYRLSADGNVLERISVSVAPVDQASTGDVQAAVYRLYFRQGPGGLTPRPPAAGPTG